MRKNIKEAIYIIGGCFIGTFGFAWVIIQVSEWFSVDLSKVKALGVFGYYNLIIHSIMLSMFIYFIRYQIKYKKEFNERSVEGYHDMIDDNLVEAIASASKQGKDEEVIRYGCALSSPLFISGNHNARYKIGKYVEDAASRSDGKIQAEMLIDPIGWSLVELGDLENGEKEIKHGLALAQEQNDCYLISRANRHLGAIERRRYGPPNYGNSEEYFNEALKYAGKITNDNVRYKAIGGCYYAIASLNYHQKRYQESINNLQDAIKSFEISKDRIGITRSMTKIANAYIALGDYANAKDLLRKSLDRAKKDSHSNQMVRASIGLAEIYITEKDWEKAAEHFLFAQKWAKKMNIKSELKDIEKLKNNIPEKYINENQDI